MATSQPRKGLAARHRWFAPLSVAAVAAVLLMGTSYVARAPLLTALARLLTLDTAGPPADYIVPLGGGPETRPFVAAALYREGVAPTMLLVEPKNNEAIRLGLVPSGAELYRRVLEIEGVPRSAIRVAPGIVDSTWGEAEAVREALPPCQPARVVVVTSPEHTRRALWTFRKVFAGTRVDVQVAPAAHLRFDETNWWQRDEGALAYLHETMKLPYYWVRYNF